ncbi:hypothetical protein [Mycolicibacterium lacusdiani]|uniref:hypothetical protein n=1 Tax=Mycolicibacterium lacusdiani TaxID=2895283 RepID=UPI001F1F5F77|nr:hypothetical protein [Mycolicibacterium lacusdiani]
MNPTCLHLLRSGKAVVAATALTVATTIAPPPAVAAAVEKPRSSVAVSLSAASTALPTPGDAPRLLVQWVQRIVVPPSFGAALPSPQFPPVVAPTSIGSSIKNVYDSVEPWVQYGFDLAAYAVGWVPYVGWLAPQIPIFYHFGERIARSVTYNIADWIDGRVSFSQGLINVVIDTFNSFVQLGIDQWNFWLPPLPPLPPLPFNATVPSAPTVVEEAATPTDTQLRELRTADEASTSPVADEPQTPEYLSPAATLDATNSGVTPSDREPSSGTTGANHPKSADLDTIEPRSEEPAEPRVEADPVEHEVPSAEDPESEKPQVDEPEASKAEQGGRDDDEDAGDAGADA